GHRGGRAECAARALDQRARLREAAGHGDAAMSRFPAHPERRPAVIAGASSGIGAATAITLGAAGYPIAVGARRLDRCEKVAAQIREAGGEAVAHQLDVTSDESVAAFAAAVRADLGDIEIVVSNAGTIQPAPILEAATSAIGEEL